MSIRQALLRALRTRFPDRAVRVSEGATEVATFPAAHPDFGDLVIHDDGHEATIALGTLTHTHLDASYSRHAALGRDYAIAEEVADFLEDLFADRIVVWCVPEKCGGHYRIGDRSDHVPPEARVFMWSGPFSAR